MLGPNVAHEPLPKKCPSDCPQRLVVESCHSEGKQHWHTDFWLFQRGKSLDPTSSQPRHVLALWLSWLLMADPCSPSLSARHQQVLSLKIKWKVSLSPPGSQILKPKAAKRVRPKQLSATRITISAAAGGRIREKLLV